MEKLFFVGMKKKEFFNRYQLSENMKTISIIQNKYNQILALSVKNNGLYSNIKKYEVPSYDR
jgi:hypothetical protein